MDTQYYTTTTSPALPVVEELVDIPSEHITGHRSSFSQRAKTLMDVDLKLIYRAIRDAIQKDIRGDEDKRVYTVAYKYTTSKRSTTTRSANKGVVTAIWGFMRPIPKYTATPSKSSRLKISTVACTPSSCAG